MGKTRTKYGRTQAVGKKSINGSNYGHSSVNGIDRIINSTIRLKAIIRFSGSEGVQDAPEQLATEFCLNESPLKIRCKLFRLCF